jgi:GTP pyrophosphokinase
MKPEYISVIMRKYGFKDWDSLLAAIGHGGLKESQVVNRLYEEYRKKNKIEITDDNILESITDNRDYKLNMKKSKSGIVVKGIQDLAVRFSKCCSPVPGDEIIGFVTRGRGISIHRTDCINAINMPEEDRARLLDAEWDVTVGKETGVYPAEIKIYANNRTGVLVDISKVLTENKIDVLSMNVRTSKQGTATISIGFEINGVEQLNEIISKLRNVESILDIERTAG